MPKHIIEKFMRMTTDQVLDLFASLPGAQVNKTFVFIPGTKDKRLLLVGHADTVFQGPPRGVEWRGNIARAGYEYKLTSGVAFTGKKTEDPVIEPKGAAPAANEPMSENGSTPTQQANPAIITPPVPEIIAPPAAPIEVVSAADAIIEAAAEAATGQEAEVVEAVKSEGKTKGKKKGKKKTDAVNTAKTAMATTLRTAQKEFDWDTKQGTGYVVVDGKRMSIPEYRERLAKEREDELKEGKSGTKSTPSTPRNNVPGSSSSSSSHSSSHSTHNNSRWSNSYRNGGLGADDRVGIAMIWLMRNSGHSILITDGEERGGIGAKAAARAIPEAVNEHMFAIEIDRMYDQEMVFYDVSTKEFEAYMQLHSGFRIERGSYTDIADVCAAGGICGVNLAAGYWNQHTENEMFCYDAWLRTYNVVRKMCYEMEHDQFLLPKKSYGSHPSWENSRGNSHSPSVQNTSSPVGQNTTGNSGAGISGSRGSTHPVSIPPIGPVLVKTDESSRSPIEQRKEEYKEGPRFRRHESTSGTPSTDGKGIGIIRTTVDPATGTKRTTREVVSETNAPSVASPSAASPETPSALFREGSDPIEAALDEAWRVSSHQPSRSTDSATAEAVAAAENEGMGAMHQTVGADERGLDEIGALGGLSCCLLDLHRQNIH